MARVEDAVVVDRLRGGDRSAFQELHARYSRQILHYVARRLNGSDAEDVTQEVFLNVYRSIASFRGESSLGAWIYGVARRTVASRFKRRVLPLHSLDDLPGFEEGLEPRLQHTDHPESLLQLAERMDRMQRAFGRLSEEQWQIFRMRHLEGRPIREIARDLNKTEDAVKSNLYRARKAVLQA